MSTAGSSVLMDRGEAPGPDRLAGRSGVPLTLAAVNLGVRFCIELATFASLGYWGASFNGSIALRALLAVAAPSAGIMAWSFLLAPRAPRRLTGLAALTVELSIFATASWALVSSGMGRAGVIYLSLAVVNAFLTRLLGQYAPADPSPEGDRPC